MNSRHLLIMLCLLTLCLFSCADNEMEDIMDHQTPSFIKEAQASGGSGAVIMIPDAKL